MEIRVFAERVLFATTLAEKLAPPSGPLTDFEPGKEMASPAAPGRPAALIPRSREDSRVPFPSAAKLIDDTARARLLHFFCNHELLAVELMALALLRFPDAPKSFRAGVARTLQEEQNHTRWYQQRMQECGLEFGAIPVTKMIWDRIAPMASPLEFVSRLSLTFEQSNLDYARHYAQILGDAGDPRSAAILGQIYRDEIAHVGHGLKWLRRWKEETESDWDAFRRSLKFPLSPVRAKGLVEFNEDGRRAAGIDEDFIQRLKVFEQSRGRTPDVWWFNPGAEEEWAAHRAGIPYQPNAKFQNLVNDLEGAFALVAPRDDVAILRQYPTHGHRERLAALGLPVPELVTYDERESLAERRLHQPRPWAWSPSVEAVFAPIARGFSNHPATTPPEWFNKWTASRMAAQLADGNNHPPGWCTASAEEARARIEAIHAAGWPVAVVKAAFGLAGRGHQFFRVGEPSPQLMDRQMVVEPWYDKVFEFSAHYDAGPAGINFVGMVRQTTDKRGRWLACSSGPKFLKGLDAELAAFASEMVLPLFPGVVRQALEDFRRDNPHDGPVGVDGFIARAGDGSLRAHPLVEINPRWTMGRLTLQLAKKICPNRWAKLSCPNPATAAALPPPVIVNGRLKNGSLRLTDPALARDRVVVLSHADGF